MTLDPRNFLGAALGGIFGILACGFIHPFAIPIGCLFGAAAGYHYEFIGSGIGSMLELDLRIDLSSLGRRIRRFCDAFRLSQLTKIYWMRFFASVTYVAIMMLLAYVAADALEPYSGSAAAALFVLALVTTVFSVIFTGVTRWDYAGVAGSREEWSAWNMSAGSYFLTNVRDLLHISLPLGYVISCVIGWMATVGVLFVAFVLLPIVVAMAGLQLLFAAALKGKYWYSFTVTLAVTITAAWLTYPYFSDARLIWIVALVTGLVSGIAAEVLRTTFVWMVTYVPFAQNVPNLTVGDATKKARAFYKGLSVRAGNVAMSDPVLGKISPAWTDN